MSPASVSLCESSVAYLCKAKRDSRLCIQLGLGFTVLCSICEPFVRAIQVQQSSMGQPRHHVLTRSGTLYELQYCSAAWSSAWSRNWLLHLPEGKLAIVIFFFYNYRFSVVLKSVSNFRGYFLSKKSACAVSAWRAWTIWHLIILFNLTERDNSSCLVSSGGDLLPV